MEGRYRSCNGSHEWKSDRIVGNKHQATCSLCHKRELFSDTEWTKIETLMENMEDERDPTRARIKQLEDRVSDLELILKRHNLL